MAHRVQINQDQTVLDDIPYSDGDIAELDDEAFNAIPPGMFTSGKLTDLGAVSGGGGFHDGQVLYWNTQATALAGNGGNAAPVTQDGTSVYGSDGADLLDITGSSLDADGVSAGDDFILQRTGADVLWFTTAGLYVVTIDSASVLDILVQADYSAGHPARTAHWQSASTADSGARGTMELVVGAMDVAGEGLSGGATFSPYVYNYSGAPQDVWVTLTVMRVI